MSVREIDCRLWSSMILPDSDRITRNLPLPSSFLHFSFCFWSTTILLHHRKIDRLSSHVALRPPAPCKVEDISPLFPCLLSRPSSSCWPFLALYPDPQPWTAILFINVSILPLHPSNQSFPDISTWCRRDDLVHNPFPEDILFTILRRNSPVLGWDSSLRCRRFLLCFLQADILTETHVRFSIRSLLWGQLQPFLHDTVLNRWRSQILRLLCARHCWSASPLGRFLRFLSSCLTVSSGIGELYCTVAFSWQWSPCNRIAFLFFYFHPFIFFLFGLRWVSAKFSSCVQAWPASLQS